MKKILLPALALLASASSLFAQQIVGTTFTKNFGTTGTDYGQSIAWNPNDSGYIVCGYTNSPPLSATNYNVYLIKLKLNGDSVWTQTYGYAGGSGDDRGYSVSVTPDGGFLLTGFYNSGNRDIYLVKTDANGSTVGGFNKTLIVTGSSNEWGYNSKPTLDGKYVVTGWTNGAGAGNNDVYLMKLSTTGNPMWTAKTFGGSQADEGYFVDQTSDSGYVISGYTLSSGAGMRDVFLVRTDKDGNSLWTKTFGGQYDDEGWCVRQTQDGGYIIAGSTRRGSNLADSTNMFVIKTNSSGDTVWTRQFGGNKEDKAFAVKQTSDGCYIVAGFTRSRGAGGSDAWLVRLNGVGDTIWTHTVGALYDDEAYSLDVTWDSAYVITGRTQLIGGNANNVYVARVDSLITGTDYPRFSNQQPKVTVSPNPFTSYTTISVQGEVKENTEVILYDLLGNEVSVPVSKSVAFGKTLLQIDRGKLTDGIYLYRVTRNGKVAGTGKLVLTGRN
jgi:TolB-like protein